MNPIEKNIRSAEAKYTSSAIDEIMGNVDDKKSAKARTDAANDAVDKAWGRGGDGAAPAAKKPGFLSRVGTAFSNFGKRVSAFFGGKTAPVAGATAQAMDLDAKTATRSHSDSLSDDHDMQNNLNVTYTRAQGRQAAQQVNADENKLDFGQARAKMARAGARAQDAPEMPDEVKQSLNVTMTRAEAMDAAKALTKAQAEGKSHTESLGHDL